MGVIKRGILGGFSGKVANYVGGSWKGIEYIRSLPLSVAQPNTAAQVGQRVRFATSVEFAKLLLLEIIQPLWNRLAKRMSGYNMFMQVNKDSFETDGSITFSDIAIADGNATGAAISAIASANGSPNVTISWVDNSGSGTALATDLAFVLVVNETQNTIGFKNANPERSDASALVVMPSNSVTGDVLHCYLAFKSANGLKISGSSYMIDNV